MRFYLPSHLCLNKKDILKHCIFVDKIRRADMFLHQVDISLSAGLFAFASHSSIHSFHSTIFRQGTSPLLEDIFFLSTFLTEHIQ